MTSSIFAQNQQFYLIRIFSRTSSRRKLVDPSMERYYQDVIKKWWIIAPFCLFFCWRQHFLSTIFRNDVTWHHVTSRCTIFMKFWGKVPLLKHILRWKFEIIPKTEINAIFVFFSLKNEKLMTSSKNPPFLIFLKKIVQSFPKGVIMESFV